MRNKESNDLVMTEPTTLANKWRKVGLRCPGTSIRTYHSTIVGLTLGPAIMPRCTIRAMAHYEQQRNKSDSSKCYQIAQR